MKRTAIVAAAVAVLGVGAVSTVLIRADDSPDQAADRHQASSPAARAELSKQMKRQTAALKQAQDQLATKVEAQTDDLRNGQRHTLRVTIRELRPYDAYQPGGRAGECVRASAAPAQLVVTAGREPSATALAEPEIPAAARLTSRGDCEAVVTVDVPFASHYRMGVAIEGHGISSPTDPGDTVVSGVTGSQSVTVLR